MFVLQRITGVITLIFIAWHVWETRIAAAFGAEVNFDMMADIVSNPFMLGFYIVWYCMCSIPLCKWFMVILC